MIQRPLFAPQTEWLPPEEFPDLYKYDEISIDLETKDPNLNIRMGSGSVVKNGFKVYYLPQPQKYFTTPCMTYVG